MPEKAFSESESKSSTGVELDLVFSPGIRVVGLGQSFRGTEEVAVPV